MMKKLMKFSSLFCFMLMGLFLSLKGKTGRLILEASGVIQEDQQAEMSVEGQKQVVQRLIRFFATSNQQPDQKEPSENCPQRPD